MESKILMDILLASIPGKAVRRPLKTFSDAKICTAASRQVTSEDKITCTIQVLFNAHYTILGVDDWTLRSWGWTLS